MKPSQIRKDVRAGRNFISEFCRNPDLWSNRKVIEDCNKFSMLHPETLALLSHFSEKCTGAILEIGPYLGGSTVAIGVPRISDEKKIITIEMGGSYDHPQLPTSDILSDLKSNLSEYGLLSKVQILEGYSNESHIIEQVENLLGSEKIDLIFIDADGNVERDLASYGHLLSDECIAIIDDFITDEALEKMLKIRPFAIETTSKQEFIDLACIRHGTWVCVKNISNEVRSPVRNPHFDYKHFVWKEEYRKKYLPYPFKKKFLEYKSTIISKSPLLRSAKNADNSNKDKDDKIFALTGAKYFFLIKKLGKWWPILSIFILPLLNLIYPKRAQNFSPEPKFDAEFFKNKKCLNLSNGANRWQNAMIDFGANFKNFDLENFDLSDCAVEFKKRNFLKKFDLVTCWCEINRSCDPSSAFINAASAVSDEGMLYLVINVENHEAIEAINDEKQTYHFDLETIDQRLNFLQNWGQDAREQEKILDQLSHFYDWSINENDIWKWFESAGFKTVTIMNNPLKNENELHFIGLK